MNTKTIKKFVSLLMASALVMSSSQMAFAKVGQESINVHYNGIVVANGDDMAIITQKEPFIYKNMVYVPIRMVSEELGYKVTWENGTNSVCLEKDIEISFINRNITKDSFYGLEYEFPGTGEIDEWGVDYATRNINIEDGYISMYFVPNDRETGLLGGTFTDFILDDEDYSFTENIFNDYDCEDYDSEYYDSLWEDYDSEYYDSLWEDYDSEYYDSLWEEYDRLWEGHPFVEKEVKTKTGTIYIYYGMNNNYTEDDVKEKLDEFMDNTVLKTGQESIRVTYKDIKIISKGKEASLEREPFIYDGTVYMAVRDLTKALNKEVEWDDTYNVVRIKDKPELGGFVFDTISEYEIFVDVTGDFICYFENGRGFVMYYEGTDFETLKSEENIKELEEEKRKEFDGMNLNLTDYKFTEVNGREYLILDYEGYTAVDIILTEMPKIIIMRADDGIIMAMYFAYVGNNSRDLEPFEKLMFIVVEE